MTTTTRPLVLNVTEAGNLLGVSRSTAYELVRTGELDSVQLRRRVVVPIAAVAERLRITIPDVWLALGGRRSTVPLWLDIKGSAPEVRMDDVVDDVHAELMRFARRRGQSLQQFLQAELEQLASRRSADALKATETDRRYGSVEVPRSARDEREGS